jgi:hydrogenase/urease accessory protein HupE
MRRAWIAAVLWLALPATADAHLMNTGLGPFYNGLAHLFVSPEDLLPVIALALLAGLRGAAAGRTLLFTLAPAWLCGIIAGQNFPALYVPPAAAAVATFALGALVAADLNLSRAIIAVAAVIVGSLHGSANGTELAQASGSAFTGLGITVSVFVVALIVAAQVATVRNATARIIIRVAGSWIAAISLLMLGWSLRA